MHTVWCTILVLKIPISCTRESLSTTVSSKLIWLFIICFTYYCSHKIVSFSTHRIFLIRKTNLLIITSSHREREGDNDILYRERTRERGSTSSRNAVSPPPIFVLSVMLYLIISMQSNTRRWCKQNSCQHETLFE